MHNHPADQTPSFFGLHPGEEGVDVRSGPELAAIGSIAALEEELDQEDRAYGIEIDEAEAGGEA